MSSVSEHQRNVLCRALDLTSAANATFYKQLEGTMASAQRVWKEHQAMIRTVLRFVCVVIVAAAHFLVSARF